MVVLLVVDLCVHVEQTMAIHCHSIRRYPTNRVHPHLILCLMCQQLHQQMPVRTVDQLVIDCDVDCIWLYIILLAQVIVEITTHRIIQNAPNMCKSGKHKKPFLKSFISFLCLQNQKI